MINKKQKSAIVKLKHYLITHPQDIKARLDLAYMYINLNLVNDAINEYKLILKNEENVQAMFNLSICFSNLKKFNESKELLKKIIKIDNNNFKAYTALGDIYFNLNKLDRASKFLNKAKKLSPDDPIILNILGMIEMRKRNYKISESYFLESIKRKKNYKSASNNLAALYQKIGKLDLSLVIYNKLLPKFPDDPYLLNNLGNILIDLNRYEDAIEYLKMAIKIDPTQSSFFSNLGRALFFAENYEMAEKMLHKSLNLESKNYEAHIIFFYLLMIKKDLKNAWKYFDSRLHIKDYFIPQNLSSLKKIKNDKILVLKEAGLGDEILYSSMYPELIRENNKVVIECDRRLKNIFKRSFNYDNFVPKSKSLRNESSLKKFNLSIYAGSLCSVFRNNLSSFKCKDFLTPNPSYVEYYKRKLRKINHLPKIGISWISTRLDLGKDKSIDLIELLPILQRKNLSFVNLQYGNFSKKIFNFNKKYKLRIIDIPELDKFNNIEKLLALISGLDLVITVSNTTAHLSGAIGKKTFMLTPDNRAQLFYWMLSKEKTPWYPSIHLYRKNKTWNDALNNIQLNLDKIFKD